MKTETLHQKLSSRYRNIPVSFVRNILNYAGSADMISFAGGLPNPELFPVKALTESAAAVMAENGSAILQYAGSLGYYPLRQWIAERYSKKYQMDITPEMVVITNGSQQALDVLAKLLVDKNDGVLLEKPSYLGAIQALSAYEPRFVGAIMESDGVNLTQVEEAFWEEDIKLMYAIPNAQNPSGISYSKAKREALALLLERYDKFLIEDDPYNEIWFGEAFSDPIKKMAPNRVAWTGSFSKMVAPGFRNGWVVLPPELVPHFDKAKQSTDLNPNNLTQSVLHHYLTHNDLDSHLGRIRSRYAQQAELMHALLLQYMPAGVEAIMPTGGMFLWASLPHGVRASELVERTMKRGVVFVPGNSFYTGVSGDTFMRLNFTNSCAHDMEKGIGIVADEVRKMQMLI